jgi:hypothetical protein
MLAAVWMLATASSGGIVHAAGFDEGLKSPAMKSTADWKAQAQNFATKYRESRNADPARLLADASLAQRQFDLGWQLERAIHERKLPGDLAALGFVSLANGGYTIDTQKHPEWRADGDNIATIFNSNLIEGILEALSERGFRPGDIAAVEQYIALHDVQQAAQAATTPIALNFQQVVRKFDTAGKTVPDTLVISYWYQSTGAYLEARRAWSEGLLKTLDSQRVRVLFSYLSELASSRTLIPENTSEAVSGTLTNVRSPDFEKRLMSTEGVAP